MINWFVRKTSHEGFADRVEYLSTEKAQLKQDIHDAMANTIRSIDELKDHPGKLADVFGQAHSI